MMQVSDESGVFETKSKLNRKVELIILLVLYFCALFLLLNFNAGNDREMFDISEVIYQGVFSSILVLILTAMVISSKTGYYAALSSASISTGILGVEILVFNGYSHIPGAFVILSGMIIVMMVHRYLVKLEKKEQQLFDIVHTDNLTELPNRRSAKKKIAELIDNSRIQNKNFAIAILDLDNFKNINDTIGHDYGDKVLSILANRWRNDQRSNEFISRLGGDEFAILIENYDTITELDQRLNHYMDVVGEKFVLKGKDFHVSGSMGVSIFPSDSKESAQLLKYADTALYAAKNQGKAKICYFDGIMNDVIERTVEMENVIRYAIENDAFSLVYQPQYRTKDKKLRGFETLIRLNDANGGPVSPGAFIPVAEKSSLIIDVDRWVLRNAMTDFKPLLAKNPDIIVSINISASHMLADHFLDDIDKVLKETGFPAKNLELELTESVFVDSLGKAKEIMVKIKERGIQIALDDFGTGYSSLSYLKELPIDLLKIDKAFVDSISDGPREESFVAAIISLSQLMQFAVISEGVEEEYQLNILRNLGCDYIQGFLWGKPQLISDAAGLLM